MTLSSHIQALKAEASTFRKRHLNPRSWFANHYGETRAVLQAEFAGHLLRFSEFLEDFQNHKSDVVSFRIEETGFLRENNSVVDLEFLLQDGRLIGPGNVTVSFDYADIGVASKAVGEELAIAVVDSFADFLKDEVRKLKANPFAKVAFKSILGR